MEVPPNEGAGGKETPWGKYIAIGCGVLVMIGVLGMGCMGTCFYGVVSSIKGSEAYRIGQEFAKSSPEIRERIGEVTGFGFMPMGSYSDSGATGQAEFTISVEGRNGSGKLFYRASKEEGRWQIDKAIFMFNGDNIELEVDN